MVAEEAPTSAVVAVVAALISAVVAEPRISVVVVAAAARISVVAVAALILAVARPTLAVAEVAAHVLEAVPGSPAARGRMLALRGVRDNRPRTPSTRNGPLRLMATPIASMRAGVLAGRPIAARRQFEQTEVPPSTETEIRVSTVIALRLPTGTEMQASAKRVQDRM